MKKPVIFVVVCVAAVSLAATSSVFLSAQETHREVVHPAANPAEDTRPNSDQVPDVYAISGQVQRIVLLRFKYKTDLLAGLEKMVKQEKIRNAVILSGVGSVRDYQLHQVANREFPIKDVVVKNPTGPAGIIGMSGVVIGGRVHAHIVLANADKAFGGDLETNTTVYTFAIVTLGVLDDGVDLSKVDDRSYR
jgi:predicted DNA-binding protein with PD1-like motif